MNDIFSSSMKGIMKYRDRTLSLSNQWLKDGHGFAKDNLDFAYQNLLQGGCGKEKAVHLITSMLKEVQVNRQSATVSTWFDTELPEGIKKVGFPDIALPLETAKGGLSGAMAETIEASIKNIRGQLLELCKQPKVEMLFEKGIKTGKGLSL